MRTFHLPGRLWLAALLAWPVLACGATLKAYNTYLYPPFLHADGSGLAPELVTLLNRHLAGRDRLELVNLPRARFLAMARQDRMDGIALFLVPVFVDRWLPAGRYIWGGPLFSDFNVLVFRDAQRPAGPLPAALRGWRFGAVRGNTYRYVEPLVARGEVRRDQGADELGNLRKLMAGRIDFTQMNHLYFKTLQATQPELHGLYAIPEPNSHFTRRVLLLGAPPATQKRLDEAVRALQSDAEWQALLGRYGLAGVTSG